MELGIEFVSNRYESISINQLKKFYQFSNSPSVSQFLLFLAARAALYLQGDFLTVPPIGAGAFHSAGQSKVG